MPNEELVSSQETLAPSAEAPESPDNSTEAPVIPDPAESPDPEAPAKPEALADPEKPKQRGGFQRRIDELTTARRIAEEQNRQLLEILQNQSKPAQAAKPADGPPDINQYQKYEDYLAAHARWSAREEYKRIVAEAEQGSQQKAEKQRQEEQQRQTQERVRDWQGMVERGETKYPDFYEVVHDGSVSIHPVMVEPIVTSEMGEEIAYYLGKNKAEAKRIAGLTPVAMIREIGKLEVTLKAAAKSQAPPPITPLSGRKAGNDKHSPEDDMRTFIAKRNKELGRT